MEKIWKKVSQNEYENCFDILNTNSLIERDTYQKFAIELFEIAKKQLGCTDCKLRFINDERNNLGFASVPNRTVTLNLNKMEKQTLYKTVSTIYHELTHIRQDKFDEKKTVDTVIPAEFPFVHCQADERFLPREILGISPFLFYYTCQHEKQARDIGNECAMELFVALKEISETKQTRTGTARFIDRCINQVQMRWNKENSDNKIATAQIQEFLKQNPNFVQDALDKIKQEFYTDATRYGITPQERAAFENRFMCRVGSLVLLGCDESVKNQILDFVANNFVNQGEIFNTLVSVVDSPYSKTSQEELSLLFKYAGQVNCPKDTLLNLLISWDKNYVNAVVNGSSAQGKNPNNPNISNGVEFE